MTDAETVFQRIGQLLADDGWTEESSDTMPDGSEITLFRKGKKCLYLNYCDGDEI